MDWKRNHVRNHAACLEVYPRRLQQPDSDVILSVFHPAKIIIPGDNGKKIRKPDSDVLKHSILRNDK